MACKPESVPKQICYTIILLLHWSKHMYWDPTMLNALEKSYILANSSLHFKHCLLRILSIGSVDSMNPGLCHLPGWTHMCIGFQRSLAFPLSIPSNEKRAVLFHVLSPVTHRWCLLVLIVRTNTMCLPNVNIVPTTFAFNLYKNFT